MYTDNKLFIVGNICVLICHYRKPILCNIWADFLQYMQNHNLQTLISGYPPKCICFVFFSTQATTWGQSKACKHRSCIKLLLAPSSCPLPSMLDPGEQDSKYSEEFSWMFICLILSCFCALSSDSHLYHKSPYKHTNYFMRNPICMANPIIILHGISSGQMYISYGQNNWDHSNLRFPLLQ